MKELPRICKECEFYTKETIEGNFREFCKPEKDKYGYTPINGTDTPYDNENICRKINTLHLTLH